MNILKERQRRLKVFEATFARRMDDCPTSAKGIMRRAILGKCGYAGAVKAMCLHCMGEDRKAVGLCTSYCCPLHRYRPFQAPESQFWIEGEEVAALPAEMTAEE